VVLVFATSEEWLSTDSLEARERGGVLAWLEYDEDEKSGGEDTSDERDEWVEYSEKLMGATGICKRRGKWARQGDSVVVEKCM
jgi:hypothetical protein